jgi:2-oxoglutarate/2-oxoacid ferredoxin oxidoreductase subunit beta
MQELAEKYIRKSALPTIFCPGCGDGTVLQAFLKAVDRLGCRDQLALVGGIGCSGWMPVYVDVDVLHVLHGRAIPFAIGLKMTDPKRKVVVFTGDGDCLGIGGNHFIHAARRNIDITVVMINNQIYGMTGGQTAPTSPHAATTQTAPAGNPEWPFDACQLAITAGATHVARYTAGHPVQLARAFQEALQHPGFSFIEAMTQCPTQTGRYMKGGLSAPDQLQELRDLSYPFGKTDLTPEEQNPGAFPIGTLYRSTSRPEFSRVYEEVRAGGVKRG